VATDSTCQEIYIWGNVENLRFFHEITTITQKKYKDQTFMMQERFKMQITRLRRFLSDDDIRYGVMLGCRPDSRRALALCRSSEDFLIDLSLRTEER